MLTYMYFIKKVGQQFVVTRVLNVKAFISEYKFTNEFTIGDSVLKQGWRNIVHCMVLWYVVQNRVTTVTVMLLAKHVLPKTSTRVLDSAVYTLCSITLIFPKSRGA